MPVQVGLRMNGPVNASIHSHVGLLLRQACAATGGRPFTCIIIANHSRLTAFITNADHGERLTSVFNGAYARLQQALSFDPRTFSDMATPSHIVFHAADGWSEIRSSEPM
jgi:hypothetical protein